ncbi:hypothetical protein HHI36_001604 [Cryptolaemus montrouzieri]|uniref:Uncharacterized protein n=1 Tax=Cryptolaemus montrouzieri TaxID=559131 RepID=A0ABD2P8T8_9CUCU
MAAHADLSVELSKLKKDILIEIISKKSVNDNVTVSVDLRDDIEGDFEYASEDFREASNGNNINLGNVDNSQLYVNKLKSELRVTRVQ